MPFRRWFAERGANHPVAYSMLTLALGMVVCMAIAVGISVQATKRAVAQERMSREQQRGAACTVINRINEAYTEDPPVTKAGVNVAAAWRDLGRTFNC
jgi:hypothetical protein